MNITRKLNADDILDLIGLERRSTFFTQALPAVGLIAVGAAIGAGIGLFFAPQSGRRLRHEVSARLEHLREHVVKDETPKQTVNAVAHS